MKKSIRLIIIGIMAFLLVGCVAMQSSVPLNYQMPAPSENARFSQKHVALQLAETQDNRAMSDPTVIAHKKNMYQMQTSGTYSAEKPVADVVNQALHESLSQVGYQVNQSSARYKLESILEEVELTFVAGDISTLVYASTQINLQLVNENTGEILWQQNISGKARAESMAFTSINTAVKKAFNTSITNAMHQLQSSNTFYSSLNK